MTKDYEVKINSVSDEAIKDTPLVISPAYYAVLDVHNEKSKEDKDFQNFIVVDTGRSKRSNRRK